MVATAARANDVLELVVMLFQLVGVGALLASRLSAGTHWGTKSRHLVVVAVIVLSCCGAYCGCQASEFGLFAGGTITVLLIGMTVGAGKVPVAEPALRESGKPMLV